MDSDSLYQFLGGIIKGILGDRASQIKKIAMTLNDFKISSRDSPMRYIGERYGEIECRGGKVLQRRVVQAVTFAYLIY